MDSKNENFNKQEWLDNLKVGDLVGYESSSRYGISRISKITPKRRMKIESGLTFNPDGSEYGSGGYYSTILTPDIDKIRGKLRRTKLIRSLSQNLDLTKLSMKSLREIERVIEADKREGDEYES